MDEMRQELAFFKETDPQTRAHRTYVYALRRLWPNLVVESDRLVHLVWNLGGPIVKRRSLELRRIGLHDYPACVERIQRENKRLEFRRKRFAKLWRERAATKEEGLQWTGDDDTRILSDPNYLSDDYMSDEENPLDLEFYGPPHPVPPPRAPRLYVRGPTHFFSPSP